MSYTPDTRPASVRLAHYLTPTHVAEMRTAEANGHELLSQGCGMFRCARCNATGCLDTDDNGRTFGGGECKPAAL